MNNKVVAFAVIVFLTLAGCDSRSKSQNDLLGKNNIVTIGAILPLTGDKSAYGISMKNALELAFEEINNKRLGGNQQINIVFQDSRGLPTDCITAFHSMLTTNNIPLVIGPMSSSEMLSIAPIAEREQVVVLSPSASSPAITDAGDFIFRIAPSDSYEGIMMATFIIERLKLSRVGIIFNNSEYGIGIVNKFKDKFTTSGGTVLISESYSEGTSDFRTQLDKIKRTNPEAIYLVGYKELGKIVKQAKELGLSARYLSVSLFEDTDVLTTAGLGAENVIFPSISFDIKSDNPRAINFVTVYSERYGKPPDAFAASAYDAAYIAAEAIREGGNDATKIKNALYTINNFNGLLGNFGFDSNGDVVLPIRLKVVKNGEFVNYHTD